MAGLSKSDGIVKDEIKPQVHQWLFPAADGREAKKIIVLSEGRLLNLGNATGHTSFVMSNPITNQVLAQIERYTQTSNNQFRVYVLQQHVDEEVSRPTLDPLRHSTPAIQTKR